MNKKYSKVYPISGDDPDFQSFKGKSNNAKSATLTKTNLAAATASSSGNHSKSNRGNKHKSNGRVTHSTEQKQYDSDCSSSIHSDDRIIQEMKYPPNKKANNELDDSNGEVDGTMKPYSKKRKPVVMDRDVRNQLIDEVLQQVLPSFGMYNNKDKEEFHPPDAFHIRWLKFIGCLSLDLHDAVLSGSLSEVERTLKKLCKGPLAKPELVNEYNSEGMTALFVHCNKNE